MTGHEVATSPDGRRAFVPIHGNSGVGLPGTDGSTLDVIDLSGGVLIPNVAVLLQSFVDDTFEFRTDRPPFSCASQVSSHRLSATIVRCGSAGVVIGGEEMRARNQAEQAALETPRDRLFIADKLKRLTPSIAGSKRPTILTMIKDEKKFALRFGRIIFDIRKAALREGKSLNTRCGAKNGPRKYFLNAGN